MVYRDHGREERELVLVLVPVALVDESFDRPGASTEDG
jgi:hypothetical protein